MTERGLGLGFVVTVLRKTLMLEHTLQKIEERLRGAGALENGQKTELLELVGALKEEISALENSQPDHARSIAGFADLSTHEAIRGGKQPELLSHAVGGLASSVQGFEHAHPRLTEVVNRLAVLLSNMGV